MSKFNSYLFILLFLSNAIYGQVVVKGKVIDIETNMPIENVVVNYNNTSKFSMTNTDGMFQLEVSKQNGILFFSRLGYLKKKKTILLKSSTIDLGEIALESRSFPLKEIIINSGVKTETKQATTVSSIKSSKISNELGDNPLPNILVSTPSVFSVRNGGGSGDASLSLRGFQQENLSLLLNGIPIGGQENGSVYWSNWLGLTQATTQIIVQKGIGISNASVNAIGGSINIITKNSKKPKSGFVAYNQSSYSNFNTSVGLNSGLLSNAWQVSTLLSFGKGKGYIDASYNSSWSYFLTASKQINKKHHLAFNLIGAPQKHGQRTIQLSKAEVDAKGLRYNKDWGMYQGRIKNASENFYHKPFFSINHEYVLNTKNTWSTAAYFSLGYGGGKWSESFNYSPSIFSYRDEKGQIDWYSIYYNNATATEVYTLDNGENVSGFATNILTSYLASHTQTGIMSNFKHSLTEKLDFQIGVHYRYFNSFLREEVTDLMGSNFFIEDYSWSLAGVSGRNQLKKEGDIIHVDNNSVIHFTNSYVQLVYDSKIINTFLSASINNNLYKRIDRFNYINNTQSKVVSKYGFGVRGGFLYAINKKNSVYINTAYVSKAPFFKYVFGNYTNVVVQNLKNESVNTIELGYKLKTDKINTYINAYYTQRRDASLLSNEYIQLEDTQTRAMINGLNALHKGIEFELTYAISPKIKLGTWSSFGDFKWQNNVSAKLFDNNNVQVSTVNVYAKNLKIGGTAQQQIGLFGSLYLYKNIKLKSEYLYYNKIFSNFDPTQRSNSNDLTQAYKIPAYGILNAYMSIPVNIKKYYGNLQLNAYNILDVKHIVNGTDGVAHDLDSFRGFWSFGRHFNFGVKVNF